jgi:hypothetical protein
MLPLGNNHREMARLLVHQGTVDRHMSLAWLEGGGGLQDEASGARSPPPFPSFWIACPRKFQTLASPKNHSVRDLLGEDIMGQAKLPSGELVDPRDVTSVTPSSNNSDWHIDVSLKNGDTIAIACASERDLQETLKRVGRLLDEGAAP